MTSRYPTSSLAAFAFLEDLLSRLRSIFPSHTVHTGTKIQIMSPIIEIHYLENFNEIYNLNYHAWSKRQLFIPNIFFRLDGFSMIFN